MLDLREHCELLRPSIAVYTSHSGYSVFSHKLNGASIQRMNQQKRTD